MEERAKKIIEACLLEKSKNPIEIFWNIAKKDFIRMQEIPEPDIAISMGCNVGCPFIGRAFDYNWGLEDPTGKSDEEFMKIISEIEKNILQLKRELQ